MYPADLGAARLTYLYEALLGTVEFLELDQDQQTLEDLAWLPSLAMPTTRRAFLSHGELCS